MKKNMTNFAVITTLGVLTVLLFFGCATFTGQIEMAAPVPETSYISPRNQDGIQDILEIPVSLPEYENFVLRSFAFNVNDRNDVTVYSEEKKTEKKNRGKTLTLPASFVWAGKTNEGEFVPEGEYYYFIELEYGKDNRFVSSKHRAVVDDTPPYVEVSSPYPLFSPNDDGRIDTVRIMQRMSSIEELWSGKIVDSAGQVVRNYRWNGLSRDFFWDGKTDAGNKAGDGVYSYAVSSTDLAGNTGEYKLLNIVADTTAAAVFLNPDTTYFSPNGDGKKDVVQLIPVVENKAGVASWNVTIFNVLGNPVWDRKGGADIPDSFIFDGKGINGQTLADGTYQGLIKVTYKNGNLEEGVSPLLYLDISSPVARVSLEYFLFSPDGDGRKDNLIINQSSSTEVQWEGSILDAAGNAVMQFSWQERAVQFTWDGKDSDNNPVPDGMYTYVLVSTDLADNMSRQEMRNIRIDTRKPVISITTNQQGASPNGDGMADTIFLNPRTNMPSEIQTWKVEIVDSDENIIKTFSPASGQAVRIPASLEWQGRDESSSVIEGEYRARLTLEYIKGDLLTTQTAKPFRIDISGPELTLDMLPRPFSPDDDGLDDQIMIKPAASDLSGVDQWTLDIFDPADNLFINYGGAGTPKDTIIWNGRSRSNELVQAASDYKVVLRATDGLGNNSSVQDIIPVDILIIRDGDNLKIQISSIHFIPNTAIFLVPGKELTGEEVQKNKETLEKLAVILKKYGQYRIRLEGHAVREYWNIPSRITAEENDELLPLSTRRAEAIKQALAERGILAERMTTIGYGGTRPVVPHSDLSNRWKNRRVEFILVK